MNFSVAVISVLTGAIAVNAVPDSQKPSPPWGTPRRPKMASSSSEKFILPAKGKITRSNEGIDISGNRGDRVVAAANGVVVESRWDDSGQGLGNKIVIRHGSGRITIYAHNHRLFTKAGQRVTRGDAIAEMGRSGKANRNHLHFQIRNANGRAIDPCQVLSCP